jgi:homoserine O-acetyltransferase
MAASPPQTFAAGDVVLQSGATLPDAQLAYTTYGELDRARTNAIVYPTRYGGGTRTTST